MSNLPSWSDASEFDSDSSGSSDGSRQRQEANDLSSAASAYELLMPSSILLPSASASHRAEAKESDPDEKAPAEASSMAFSMQNGSALRWARL